MTMLPRQYTPNEDRNILGDRSDFFAHSVRPSRSSSRDENNDDDDDDDDEEEVSSVSSVSEIEPLQEETPPSEKPAECRTQNWTPYTFSHPYLVVLSLVALGLCLVTFLLWWRSSNNYGLGRDDGTSAMLFGWRYSPTLIAVIYVQMATVLFEDVKRTEPYARLAKPDGAMAPASILKAPAAWWTVLYDGFSKKRNGSRSMILILVSFLNIMGFMAISPLSSAFLFSENVALPQTADFIGLLPAANSPLPINADRSTNFRALANLLQNVSTSPWITDEYTILPFWPSKMQDAPITSLPTRQSQKWEAETTMFKTEFKCTEMTVEHLSSANISFGDISGIPSYSFIWGSPDGCKYGLNVTEKLFDYGGGSWSDSSTFYEALSEINHPESPSSSTNSSAECDNREIIILSESWKSSGANYMAQVCDTNYWMANVSTTISLDADEPEITFDNDEFQEKKISIPDNILNTTEFSNLMLNKDWTSYIISVLWSKQAALGGPSILLGALYDYDMSALLNDPDWVQSAAKAKQRYFGEVLQASLTRQGASQKVSMQGNIHDVETRVVVQPGPAIALGVLFAISFLSILAIWGLSRPQKRPLNLKEDPASTMGVAFLITDKLRTILDFRSMRQPSAQDLNSTLEQESFNTDPKGLSRVSEKDLVINGSSQSANGTPKLFRLPALLSLTTVLIAVVVGVSVLYHFASTSGLYEKAFVYQVQVSFFDNGLSSVAPFAMIPTVIATGIGLWWSAMDENFRRLQPYLAMAKGNPTFSRGASLSYQSAFWLWACSKAAMNKHWLLALLTLGSSLSPVFTTTMSALFDRGPGVISDSVMLNRTLEIRTIPHVFPTKQSLYPDASNDYVARIIADLYSNMTTHWMYTATIQLALNGSQPAWSKDGWSFVPAMMDNIENTDSAIPNDLDVQDQAVDGVQSNVSFSTPALRGRIECSAPPRQALLNVTNWLTPIDLSNMTYWNKSTVPDGLRGGFQLGRGWRNDDTPSVILPLASPENYTECHGCTTAFATPSEIVCCGNRSSNAWDPTVAVGYWSPNVHPNYSSPRMWNLNFTTKLFYGEAVTGIKNIPKNSEGREVEVGLLFPNIPSTSYLNCKPLVESAMADVIVDPKTGDIQDFNITDTPKEMPDAFSDNYVPHNQTHINLDTKLMEYNVTLSFGRLFMSSLLTAADTLNIGGGSHVLGYTEEELNDNTYNIRDEINGLNMDFMTYAMYTMAGKDATNMLDPDTFETLAQKTFTTFFQHFVNNELSMQTGGWAYQKINASLPKELGPALDIVHNYLPGTKASKHQDVMHPISHTNRTVEARLTRRVELLQMNSVAVWLSISIMAWLIITTVVVALLQKRYFGSLVRNVECLGDVLVLIAGSTNLLQVVREIQAGRLLPESYEHLRTKLGWFVDEDGGLRWGVEMEESYGEGPGVHWISAPYLSKEKGSKTWNLGDEQRSV